jgi:hypothetical protein
VQKLLENADQARLQQLQASITRGLERLNKKL